MESYKKQSQKKYISLRKLRLVANSKRSFKKQPSKGAYIKYLGGRSGGFYKFFKKKFGA